MPVRRMPSPQPPGVGVQQPFLQSQDEFEGNVGFGNGNGNSSYRFNPRDADDIYAEIFGAENGGGGGGRYKDQFFRTTSGGYGGGASRKALAVETVLPCSLEELYKGVKKKMKISRNVCDASGYAILCLCFDD